MGFQIFKCGGSTGDPGNLILARKLYISVVIIVTRP